MSMTKASRMACYGFMLAASALGPVAAEAAGSPDYARLCATYEKAADVDAPDGLVPGQVVKLGYGSADDRGACVSLTILRDAPHR